MKSQLVIPIKLYNKIMFFVDNTDNEISGMGRLVFSEGKANVTNVYLLEQEVGPAKTDIDETSLSKLMYESRADDGLLNFWWHSHVNMGSRFSCTDDETIKEIGGRGFVIAMVINKRREYQIVYHSKGDDKTPMVWQEMDLVIDHGNGDLAEEWKKEIAEKCKVKTYSTFGNNYYGRSALNDDHWLANTDTTRNVWNRYQQRFTSPTELANDEVAMNGETDSLVSDTYVAMDYWDKDDWKDEFIQQYGRNPKKGELVKFRKKVMKEFNAKK